MRVELFSSALYTQGRCLQSLLLVCVHEKVDDEAAGVTTG
jgi:hypothetical protein